MGERSKGKFSHASSYGSSRTDKFHPGINLHEAYWKNHRGNNPSMPNWQRDRRQVGGTDNPTAIYYMPDSCKRIKKPINPNLSSLNYSSVQNSDALFSCPQNHRSHRNKISLINNAGILRKENDFTEEAENDADEEDDEEELGDEAYFENGINDREEEEEKHQVESCHSCETAERDNEDPDEEVDETYGISSVSPNLQNKYEKRPSPMMEKLKMLELAHAQLKMNQQRRFQKKYQNILKAQRNSQDNQNQEITDEATEDDDEILQRSFRKVLKQPINYRQLNSWLPSRNQDNYSPNRYSQQAYNYPKKYVMKQGTMDPNLESYGHNRPCRYCGGTGNDFIEPTILRKINCRVNDPAKVNFNIKEKLDGESGDQGERCISGRRISPRMHFLNIPPTNIPSQKSRRSRNTRSPTRA